MSRGIDFKTVNQVVNFDFPQSLVSYIHRIGRTGRGGKQGKALTLFTDEDKEFVRSIANLMKKSGDEVPEWMLNLKQTNNKTWKKLEKRPIKRQAITTEPKKYIPKRFLKNMQKNMNRSGRFQPDPRDMEDDQEWQEVDDE